MAGLFSKSKGGPKEKQQLMDLLKFIVTGTQTSAGGANVPNALAEKISKLEPGLIQPKAGATIDVAGNILVYATSKGMSAVLGSDATQTAAASPMQVSANGDEAKPQFKLEEGIPLPVSKRGGIKGDTYPFAQMKIGQSFFVPATEEKPTPAKSLASTASSASKRLVETGRKFVVRPVTNDAGEVTGARVWCVAVEQEAEEADQVQAAA